MPSVDLPGVSANFPSMPEPQVSRDAHLRALEERVFAAGAEVALVNGEEGTGKTTLLAQFALQNPSNTISVFVRGTSPLAHDPSFAIRDLANQAHWAVERSELPPSGTLTLSTVNELLFNLSREANRGETTPFYFVFDGLHEVRDEAVRAQLVELIPMGIRGFRCVMSDRRGVLRNDIRGKVRVKELELLSFSRTEMESVLRDLSLSRDEIDDVWEITQGNPGQIAQARRQIQGGKSARQVLDGILSEGGLFGAEWRRISDEGACLFDLYAVVAFDRRECTIESVARILGADLGEVRREVLASTLLEADNNGVRFRTEAFQDQIREELASRADRIRDLIVADLVATDDAGSFLPETYFDAGRYSDVLDTLDPSAFQRIASEATSISVLSRLVDCGRVAAEKTAREADLLRFAIDGSVLREVAGVRVWSSQMEAYLANGQYDRALRLAQSAALDEERLFLLARLSSAKIAEGQILEPELESQIRTTYERLDVPPEASTALDIAGELVNVCPELAVDLVERVGGAGDGPNSLDAALAYLTVSAATNPRDPDRETQAFLQGRIEDQQFRQMAQGFASLIEDRSGSDVVEHLKVVESVSARLYLLREWIRNNPESSQAATAAMHGLETAIQTPDYSPNARVVKDLALPLPHIPERDRKREMIELIDVQLPGLRKLGPAADYFQLQLVIAEAMAPLDAESAQERLLNIFFEIEDYPEKVERMRAFGRLSATMEHLVGRLEDPLDLRSIVEDRFDELLRELLADSAHQFLLVRPIIEAFSHVNLERALVIARSLNTQRRRDEAIREAIHHGARSPVHRHQWDGIRRAIDEIGSHTVKDKAILDAIEGMTRNATGLDFENIAPILTLAPSLRHAAPRCRSIVRSLNLAARLGVDGGDARIEGWLEALERSWEEIGRSWTKVGAAYGISRDLAEYYREQSVWYLQHGETCRSDVVLDTPEAGTAYHSSIRLATRAFAGLVAADADSKEDLTTLVRVVERESSLGERIRLLSRVALVFFGNDRRDEGHELASTHLRPLVTKLPDDEDAGYRDYVMRAAFPPLYLDHPASAKELLEAIDPETRDAAISDLIHFKLTRHAPSDAYLGEEGRSDLIEVNDLKDAVDLLALFTLDQAVFGGVARIVATLNSPGGRQRFNARIRLDLANRMSKMVDQSLPKREHIAHDGYLLAAQAHILRLRADAGDLSRQDWAELIAGVEGIPNLADRVFVSAIALHQAPHKIRRDRQVSWVKQLREDAERLALSEDRSTRLEVLAKALDGFDKAGARALLESAIKDLRADGGGDHHDSEAWSQYRRILDAAHDLDEEFAANLASLFEKDEGLQPYRERFDTLRKEREALRSLSDPDQSGRNANLPESSLTSTAAWEALASLNAGRSRLLSPEVVLPWLSGGASLPLREAYPLICLVIQHLSRVHLREKRPGENRLRGIFHRTIDSTDISYHLLARAKNDADAVLHDASRGSVDKDSVTVATIGIGDIDTAREVLRNWFAADARDYVKIIDPYFGPEELVIFRDLLEFMEGLRIKILAGQKRQDQVIDEGGSMVDAYRRSWKRLFDVPPGFVEVTVIEAVEGREPIHDRMMLSNGAGLLLGTSLNALGTKVESTIKRLTRGESASLEAQYDQYFRRERRPEEGVLLRYSVFDL